MAQPSSNTYAFSPAFSDLTLEAFARCGIPPSSLTANHLFQVRMSANLMQAAWQNRQVNLWRVNLQGLPLTQGQATYELPITTIAVLDSVLRTNGQPFLVQQNPATGVIDPLVDQNGSPLVGNFTGDPQAQQDLVLYPISRTEYMDQPNKLLQARPTTFWFDRTITPTVTFWPCPDVSNTYGWWYYAATSIQDAVLENGATLDMPVRFLEAFASDLAARLARKFAPALAPILKLEAKEAWMEAEKQDAETGPPLFIYPGLSGYFR